MTGARSRPRVLAAFVNHNGAAMTAAAVASLFEQRGVTEVRAIVVDNGSSAADIALLKAMPNAGTSIVQLERNRGYAAACNVASQLATESAADYVWWLNNDVLIEAGALDALVRHLDLTPRAAAAAAVTVDWETGERVLGAGMDLTLWRSSVRNRHEDVALGDLPAESFSVAVLPATCVLVRVDALRVIGGIDEGYFMYGEDVDWSVRARNAGYTLDVVPVARVRHARGRSSSSTDRVAWIMRARIRLIRARGSLATQPVFLLYYGLLWLPAYTVGRLVPRFGLRAGLHLAADPLVWNVRDAVRRRRWRLRPEDLQIPRFT